MIDWIKKVLGPQEHDVPSDDSGELNAHDVRIATCALFVEMAKIDDEFSDEEKELIFTLLQKEYELSQENVEELVSQAEEELEGSIDLWKFTNMINENYSDEEKIRIIELIWKLIYADKRLDKHEDYLVHKLAKLLGIEHKHLIDAKVKILRSPE